MKEQLRWIVGDASHVWKIHSGKPWMSIYVLLKVFESVMRGFGQVCFANNPWSGVLILVGLVVADPVVGLGSFIASVTSLIMSRILDQPDAAVVSGLQNYSAVLVGSVTISLFPVFFNETISPQVWCGIVIMSALSVCVGIGLAVLLSPVQLPVYTLPFNVTTSLMFLCFHSSGLSQSTVDESPNQEAINATEIIEWTKVFEGVLKSSGQVYAVEDTVASVIILVALVINSPFLTIMSFIGGLLSTVVGLLITTAPYSAIYAGVWGYNGFLGAGCIAFFVYPNILSVLLALLNAIFAAFVHCGITPVFAASKLPVFTFPFCLASLLFLGLIASVPGVERVKDLTFPEEHIWKKRKESNRIRVRCQQDTHL